jgi:5-methyltetrahydrofolate--homocysteine methyltransferase
LIVIETMSDLREAKAAVLAAKEHSTLPVLVTMTFEEDGRTFLGTPPEVAALTLSSLGASALGVNCSLGPAEMADTVEKLCAFSRCPVIVRPNAGLPHLENGQTVFDVAPEDFGKALQQLLPLGPSVLGGCCGTTPAFTAQIKALVDQAGTTTPRNHTPLCGITSAQEAVWFEPDSHHIALIGERINPTGKPKLKDALRANNLDYLIEQAVEQRDAGADILDVNVGLPEINEPEVLSAAVQKLQSTVTLPLVIDSSDPVAIEQAIRGYAGKPLINSVNGKQENLDAILPLAKHYGCAVIGLTLDEGGIPPTAEARFEIAQRIVEEARHYGIPKQDIVIDCLTMAAATNQDEAIEILRAVSMVKEKLGVRTVLGVSNISFGLPQRMQINSTFLAAAFGAGLDMPIMNPNSERYRDVVNTYKIITGQDKGAAAYIEFCSNNEDPYDVVKNGTVAPAGTIISGTGTAGTGTSSANSNAGAGKSGINTAGEHAASSQTPVPIPESLSGVSGQVAELQNCILAGRSEPVGALTEELIKSCEPLDLIDGIFIPTLDEVGIRFDKGTFFLPQLMASAEAVKAGFDVVKAHMGNEATQSEDKPIILATVKGDIHDIGKNIVKMLLENYGYHVIDLGRDVAPEPVLEAVKEHHVGLVGLSALMTTTVKSMEQTIELLHTEAPEVKIMVGGAVLTPEYAKTIGADWYAKDAAESARIAESYFA